MLGRLPQWPDQQYSTGTLKIVHEATATPPELHTTTQRHDYKPTMYGSYGSYSSMSATTAPMDITASNLRAHDATCAFPSWPRRSSLSDSDSGHETRATSFLSDDDLFLSDPFEDDVRSVSSGSSTSGSASPAAMTSPPRHVSDTEVLEMERLRLEAQRDFVRHVISEKERRRQQLARRQLQQHRQRSPSAKKSPSNKSKLSAMTPIAE